MLWELLLAIWPDVSGCLSTLECSTAAVWQRKIRSLRTNGSYKLRCPLCHNSLSFSSFHFWNVTAAMGQWTLGSWKDGAVPKCCPMGVVWLQPARDALWTRGNIANHSYIDLVRQMQQELEREKKWDLTTFAFPTRIILEKSRCCYLCWWSKQRLFQLSSKWKRALLLSEPLSRVVSKKPCYLDWFWIRTTPPLSTPMIWKIAVHFLN